MKKDDLKSLVSQMHKELLNNIDSQKEVNKEMLISYLTDAIKSIKKIHDDEIDSIEHAKLAFTNAYKEIAQKSISSYKHTNGKFEELSKLHKMTLDEAKDHLIDIPNITEKFDEIQSYMLEEVEKANAIISQLTHQIKELEDDSNLDALTKVFNRRALERYLKKIMQKGSLKHELYLLILDIDDFKSVNDMYGHIVGDKVLIFIANLLRSTLRDGDKIFRYGGEEFVIILNRITKEKCQEITQRILQTISTSKLIYKDNSVNVTTSIGVTKYIEGDTPDSLIDRADKALYHSKERGKNQLNMEFTNGH
ncbi:MULTISPECIES: GGDEF domain-containing protein [Sulfurimonas]|uniref:GGDEF domain-containing protein n=1 Tax=Sulfurimonas TaxID=202746 RepID=UPI001264A3C3|nr:GGDEF domain-containing protein [Sulfurimonas indica]